MIARFASTALARTGFAAVALAAASAPAQAQNAPTLTEENFPAVIFTAFCLATSGNLDLPKQKAEELATAEPPEAITLSAEDRAELVGPRATHAWMFLRPEEQEPVFLSYAVTDSGNEVCQVLTLGTHAEMSPIFSGVLEKHSEITGHVIYDSGDASFLERDNLIGDAYTVEMSETNAYVMLTEERDETVTGEEGLLKLTALFDQD